MMVLGNMRRARADCDGKSKRYEGSWLECPLRKSTLLGPFRSCVSCSRFCLLSSFTLPHSAFLLECCQIFWLPFLFACGPRPRRPFFGGVRVILRANCLASLAVNSVVYRLTPYRMSIYISIPSVYPTILPSIHPSVYPTARRTPLALLLPICRVMLISDIILTAKQIQLCPTPL